MSRIGNKHILIPQGVNLTFDGGVVTVSGPKGTLTQTIDKVISVKVENGQVEFIKNNAEQETDAKQGLYRALVANMIKGVNEGWSKSLVINGVGYKAQVNGNKLVLGLGKSHPEELTIPADLKVTCPSITEVIVSGIDRQKVGQFASNIRDLRPVEPYHAYGIRYSDEVVVRKVGKAAGKGKK